MRFRKAVLFRLVPMLLAVNLHGYDKEVITGPQYREATLKSIDVLSSHLTLLQAQAMHDQILNSISYTIKFAPANLRLNDDSVHRGSFVRSLLPTNLGYGSVSGIGFYLGLQGDYIKVFDLTDPDENDEDFNPYYQAVGNEVTQVIAYAGVSVLGFQLDAGIMGGVGFKLDQNGEFAQNQSELVKDTSILSANPRYVYSMYHKTGVYASAIFNIDTADEHQTLSDFKINIQPVHQYLPEFFGMPFLDILAYTPLSDYYAKYLITDSADSKPKSSRDYDFSYGSDNLFIKGFRPSMTLKVRPHVAFRKIDAAYVKSWGDGAILFGSRTAYFHRGGDANLSLDIFASIPFLGLSYSYNSPDNQTFLPLPGLHVWGVQLIWGARETAKQLFPFMPDVDDD